MALLGDIRESTIQEKEMIDADLHKMGESLQQLKASVEKDATILAKADFSDLLGQIVSDLSALSQTADILLLQQALQSQENLTAVDLDKIIQQFISVKLEYTANKSLHLTDTSLQKYKQLIEHKSAMDDLLLKIAQNPSSETLEASETSVAPEVTTNTPETSAPVAEALDLEVVKAQQALIDGEKITPVEDVTKKDDQKEEKKSWWDRAKNSSFGLAYIFGADRISSTKEWISEKWNDFKEWIGGKKKEKKDDKDKDDNSSPQTASEISGTPEETQSSIVSFDAYQENAYNSYSSVDKQNLDATATVSKDMYKEVSTGLQKDKLPPLIRDYDSTLDAFSGKYLAVIGKHFGTIKDLTDYTFLENAGNTTSSILGSIVDFLSKRQDDKWIGWLASLIKKPFDLVQSWVPTGDDQKENKLKDAIQKQISENVDIKSDVDMFVKQITLARFYFMEKKKIISQDPNNTDSLDGLTISQAMEYLKSKNLLDATLSMKTKFGIDANRAALVIKEIVADTQSDVDLSDRRGDIYFNYEKQQLESRGKATPLEVNAEGTSYRIIGFNMSFSSLKEVIWLANLSNRFVADTSTMQSLRNKKSDRFVYYSNIGRPGYPGLYINKDSNKLVNLLPSLNADRVLSGAALFKNIPSRTTDMGDVYASYMNNRVSSIREVFS